MKQANQIVLFTNDRSADTLLINTLVKHYQKITVVLTLKEFVEQLKEETPKVFLASGEKFQDTLTTFCSAIDQYLMTNYAIIFLYRLFLGTMKPRLMMPIAMVLLMIT